MNIELDCGNCDGVVSFAPRRGNNHGRLIGTCQTCGSVYSLYGGQVTPIQTTPPSPAPKGWRFRSLVDHERHLVLDELAPEPEPEAGAGAAAGADREGAADPSTDAG